MKAASDKLGQAQYRALLEVISLKDAVDLGKYMKDTYGIEAVSGAVMMAEGSGNVDGTSAKAQQTAFDVVLNNVDSAKKIAAIKVVREATGLGLAEAKAFVETSGKPILRGLNRAAAEQLAEKFAGIGVPACVTSTYRHAPLIELKSVQPQVQSRPDIPDDVRRMRPGLDTEASCFERDLQELLASNPGGFAVYFGDKRVGIFPTYDAALEAGFDATGCNKPFLARRIEARSPEPSSWEAGRPIG